jgi:hypothetical protein
VDALASTSEACKKNVLAALHGLQHLQHRSPKRRCCSIASERQRESLRDSLFVGSRLARALP